MLVNATFSIRSGAFWLDPTTKISSNSSSNGPRSSASTSFGRSESSSASSCASCRTLSVPLVRAIELPCTPSTTSPRSFIFSCSSGQRRSSTLFFATKYSIVTCAVCPMRWHRSSACSSAAGVQKSSVKTAREAAVRVMATPAAVMPSTAARIVGSFWKRLIRAWRSFGLVRPSMRTVWTPLKTLFSSASSTLWWWANTRNLGAVGSSRRPCTCLLMAGSFATPVSLNSFMRRFLRCCASSRFDRLGSDEDDDEEEAALRSADDCGRSAMVGGGGSGRPRIVACCICMRWSC
mmetsp:Transcript_63611/g.175456  ORF Transcript_63611/g.175456 Transcript_63611/m.175456 type:complete len:292 (-) Transcript_63611:35-910(-)